MGADSKKKGGAGIRAIAILATLGLATLLFWDFANALTDGLAWKRQSDLQMVSPSFEERDLTVAKQVPDFHLTDRFGRPVSFGQFASADMLLVNLWSSNCEACEREIPSLAELDRRLGGIGKVALLTITIDEKWSDVEGYFPFGTDLRVLFDPENKVDKEIFGTTKFPETFILDKSRRIRARFDGERVWHSREMLDYISSYL